MTQELSVLISAGIAAVISITTAVYTYKQNTRRFYAEKSIEDRRPWVVEMREYAAELLTVLAMYPSEQALSENNREKFEHARQEMLIRLNPPNAGYQNDDYLRSLLQGCYDEVQKRSEEIRNVLTSTIKHERDKLRLEAGRTNKMHKKIRKDQK